MLILYLCDSQSNEGRVSTLYNIIFYHEILLIFELSDKVNISSVQHQYNRTKLEIIQHDTCICAGRYTDVIHNHLLVS